MPLSENEYGAFAYPVVKYSRLRNIMDTVPLLSLRIQVHV